MDEHQWELMEDEVIGLHGQWRIYNELYDVSRDRVDLLNRSAGTFFALLQRTLIRDIYVGIGRLTDRVTSAGRNNLTLYRIADLPAVTSNPALAADIQVALDVVRTAAAPFRTHRNRRVAHLDLATVTGAEVLPGIAKQDVDTTLRAIAAAMNAVKQHLKGTTTFYEEVIQTGGAEALVRRLEQADKWRAEYLAAKRTRPGPD